VARAAPHGKHFRPLEPQQDHNLQFAFFNGVGWESWENIWGIWNGVTPRDGEATRRVATIERAIAEYLVSRDWEPIYPMLRYGVFASRWPLNGGAAPFGLS